MHQRHGQFGESGAAINSFHVHLACKLCDQEIRQRHTGCQCLLEYLRSSIPHKGIGILTVGQKDKVNLTAFANLRQGRFECPPGSSSAGLIAVKTEEHILCEAEQAVEVIIGRRRAECGDAKVDALTGQTDNVHVTFDDNEPHYIAYRLTSFVQAIKFATFMKKHRLRRIQIFGFIVGHHAAAETDAPASRIAYRKHDAVAESVVMTAIILANDEPDREEALDRFF